MDKARAEKAASIVIAYLGTLDPTWAERLSIMKLDHNWDDLQTIGSCAAQILEAGMHTVIPQHSFFEPGFAPPEEGHVCPECERPFMPAYPGQPVCCNQCAISYYKPEKVQVRLEKR